MASTNWQFDLSQFKCGPRNAAMTGAAGDDDDNHVDNNDDDDDDGDKSI